MSFFLFPEAGAYVPIEDLYRERRGRKANSSCVKSRDELFNAAQPYSPYSLYTALYYLPLDTKKSVSKKLSW